MDFELKPDFEHSFARYEAFWAQAIVDRPLVRLPVTKVRDTSSITPGFAVATAKSHYPNHRSRWLDIDARVEQACIDLDQFDYLGDAMPIIWPNMGPEIFSAWCGAGYEFGETTTWSIPSIHDWESDASRARFDDQHPLFLATVEMTDKLIERGKGRFIVGLTDLHPGGDHLAALRDPQNLATDLLDHPDEVKQLLSVASADYFRAYDMLYDKIAAADMPTTSWLGLLAKGRYYIPSNDFSCMIGPSMFEEFFLPGIVEECRFLDHSIYHLDGPGALRHLDTLLEIPELDAIQWVPGAGNEGLERWVSVYQRIQEAGKGIEVQGVTTGNIDLLFEELRPEGVFICSVGGVDDRESAEAVLKHLERWSGARHWRVTP